MQGFITIHRQLMESSVYKDSHAVHLWLHLLMKANHKDKEFIQNGKMVMVKRGQTLTGRKVLSAETGIQESKIQRLLKLFESMHMIEQHTNNRNRLITVLSYDKFQAGEQHTNNTRTTGEQLVNTNNNVNNNNNVKKDSIPYLEIKNIWNECTPNLPSLVSLSDKRKKAVKKLWDTTDDESKYIYRDLDFFRSWFTYCNQDIWYNGTDPNNTRDWRADFEFCLKVDNILKKQEV